MRVARDILRDYPFESHIGSAIVRREPIGVCALISPWNWPIQTGVIKIVYALAAGCTIVAKPSMNSAASGALFAQVLHEANVPPGVFNLVNGAGRAVGDALSRHPDVDMISFTGSTGAGRQVVSPPRTPSNACASNSAGSRLTSCCPMPTSRRPPAGTSNAASSMPGNPATPPPACWCTKASWSRWCHSSSTRQAASAWATLWRARRPWARSSAPHNSSRSGISSRAVWMRAPVSSPEGWSNPRVSNHGYFVQPTVFADVTPEMTIAREEVFGPVLAVMPYRDEDDALRIANDSPYGLGGFVFGGQEAAARRVVNGLRTGRVSYNGAATDSYSPMGGYKQSGIGRSMGRFGLEEYLEVKSVYGFEDEAQALPPLFG